MSVSVSIVIPTWNGRRLLEQFLPSITAAASQYSRQPHRASEILIVDDGSTDDTAEWIASQAANSTVPIRLVRHEDNLGFGAAANRGLRDAAFPLVWLLNNDVEVDDEAMASLAAPFEEGDATLFAVHSRMIDLTTDREVGTGKMGGFGRGFLRVHRSYVPGPGARGPFWSMFATGGSAMFDRARFLELGGFDPLFAPFYFEDVELSYRAWKRGFTVRYQPQSLVRHRFSSTINVLGQRHVERISQRNRLLFQWMHVHDRRYFASHLFWLFVLLVSAPLTLKHRFIGAFSDAVRRLPMVRTRRREERARAVRSDRDVLRMFTEMQAKGEIRAYDDPRELEE